MDIVELAVLKKICRYVILMLMCFSYCRPYPRPMCQPVTLPQCVGTVNITQLPNVYGHYTQQDIDSKTMQLFQILGTQCPSFTKFLCVIHLPPCPDPTRKTHRVLPLPCRQVCELAWEECHAHLSESDTDWPYDLQCHNFPTEKCLMMDDSGFPVLVDTSLHAAGGRHMTNNRQPEQLAPLESELGDNDDYSIEIVSMTANQIPQRRYDVIELGDEDLYHGWADVQGIGAASDYCRILGRGKRRFLSCALAGSSGQAHLYVSKLGFDVGHKNTWFMRDVDNDGRDDYCRCVGKPENSRISCMKAGEKAFYGSTVQGGSQYSFDLPGSNRCHDKRLNPHFGA